MHQKLFVLLTLSALTGCAQVEAPPVSSVVTEASGPAPAQPAAAMRSPSGGGSPTVAKGAASNPPVDASAGHKGLRMYLDPATGETRPPTAAELAAEAAARRASNGEVAVKASEPVNEIKLPNGMTEVQVGKQAEVAEVVCVLDDGSVGECPRNSASTLRAKPKP